MGIISTGSFAKDLWPGVNAWYQTAYKEHVSEFDKIFDLSKSSRAYEEDVGVSSFGLAKVKNEGAAIQFDEESQSYIQRYTHVTYGLGFIITREMNEDGLSASLGQRRSKSLAFSMNQTKETVGANIYNRGFNASYTYGDGSTLLNATHARKAGGTWSNVLATAANLSQASIEQACIDISKFTNDRGLKIAVMANSLHIPPELQFDAERILGSTLESDTANNAINPTKGKFKGGVHMNHYFTDTNAWFIRTNVPDGMKCFERRADEFQMDNDFDTQNARYISTARYSFGASDPRGVFGTAGAA